MVESNGALVTYEELERQIQDFDKGGHHTTSLYQHVATLRKALGDTTQSPSFIKTISKQGYQFVGEVTYPSVGLSGYVNNNANKLWLALLVFVLLVGAIFMIGSPTKHANGYEQVLIDLSESLRNPDRVVVLQYSSTSYQSPIRGLQNAIEVILKFHLEQKERQHLSVAPEFSTSDGHKKLEEHFSVVSSCDYLLQPKIIDEGGGKYIVLTINDIANNSSRELLRQVVDPQDFAGALPRFEQTVLRELKSMGLVDTDQRLQLMAGDASNQLFLQAASVPLYEFNHWEELDFAITKSHQAIQLNPSNMIAYTVFWDAVFLLIDQQSKYNMDKELTLLESYSRQAVAAEKEYFKAQHAYADYFCRTQEFPSCAESLKTAMELHPYDASVLNTLRFNLKRIGKSPLAVTRKNYYLNPFVIDVLHFHRNALLQQGKIQEAVKLVADHAEWRATADAWNVWAQTKISPEIMKDFSAWYSSKYLGAQTTTKADLPSRYISYMLLNVNQPELARYWVNNGREENLPYFDLFMIDFLVDLWQGDWSKARWQEVHDIAMNRREFQNAMDKHAIAYFDYYAGMYNESGYYIEELFPEFAEEKFNITIDNFRYAVYYNEIRKRLGDHRRVIYIDHSLRNFLKEQGNSLDRNVYFGIADVEFYALSGESEKALSLLEYLVEKEYWQPNAFWLWPPIEHNHFLKNLHDHPRFKRLNQIIQSRYAKLCFKAECE